MRSLSLRAQFALALIGLTVTAAAVLASFAYRTSQESLSRQAVATARIAADAREYALTRELQGQHDRLRAFLGSLESLCGERTSRRTAAFEPECVHVAVAEFQQSERAAAVELRVGNRRVVASGTWPEVVGTPEPGSLATVLRTPTGTMYAMQALRPPVLLRVVYALDALRGMFTDRSGLQINGHVAFVDKMGVLMPQLPDDAATLNGRFAQPLARCLAGESGELLVDDTDGDGAIAGFQPAGSIPGCIVARLDYEEALAPIRRLGRLFVFATGALILVGAFVSWIIARTVTTPIARLAVAARELEVGRFDADIPRAGPKEVRQLGRALSRMARSIGELVQREHDARVEAEAANRTKDDFLATLGHELRTPLTAITGWVSMLRHRTLPPERAEHALRVIERSARTEARLIEDLLDVTRIINGQLRLKLDHVSVVAAVDAAIESVRPPAELKGVSLNKHVEGEPAMVVGDPHRLQQIVWNLLANAVRFTPRGGRVDVTLRESGATAEVSVSDTGIGIGSDLLPHVFDRFRQGETGTMRAHGGLGLGLAIVRHLVELHGGQVRVESDGPGKGSTFTVALPTAHLHAPAVVAPSRDASPSVDLSGTRILVVDDDPDTREVVQQMLEGAGASVATTASARDTRMLIDRLHPDLLIADIGMPEEDGYALIRSVRARETGPRLPAIALTAHARAEDVERALESGFQIHVAKPVDSSTLLTTVATLLQTAA